MGKSNEEYQVLAEHGRFGVELVEWKQAVQVLETRACGGRGEPRLEMEAISGQT